MLPSNFNSEYYSARVTDFSNYEYKMFWIRRGKSTHFSFQKKCLKIFFIIVFSELGISLYEEGKKGELNMKNIFVDSLKNLDSNKSSSPSKSGTHHINLNPPRKFCKIH